MNETFWPVIGILLWLAIADAPALAGKVLTNPGSAAPRAGI